MTELIANTVWRCPKGKGIGVVEFDLAEIYLLESRKNEIGSVTKVRAPELMQAFERGYSLTARYHIHSESELSAVKISIERRKAIIATDVAPVKLKEKGLTNAKNPAGSVDLRESIIAQDEEYLGLLERRDQIQAITDLLKVKMRGFEMAYQSVKKVFDSLSGLDNPSHNTPEESPEFSDMSSNMSSNMSNNGRFNIGKARY